jgi:hypothetical protein
MSELDAALRVVELPSALAELLASLSRATSHVPQRRIRHDFFFAMLTQPDALWQKAFKTITPAEPAS